MTESLRITTLGGLDIRRDGEPVTGLASRKAEALLVYLACTAGPHPRESLATMLWDDRPQSRAMGNLSVLLTSLRKQLARYLIITPKTIAFNLESDYWLDAAELDARLSGWPAGEAHRSAADMQALADVLALYHGDFLAGFYPRESSGFEAWALLQQERLRVRVIDRMVELVEFFLQAGHYQRGIEQAQRLLHLDSLREETHRTLMLLLARNGQRSAALAQFEDCKRILAEELGVEPTRETVALYKRIRAMGDAPTHNLPSPATPLIGRREELNDLAGYLANPQCRLVTIVGPGGIGKTRLAFQAAEEQLRLFINGVYQLALAPVCSPDELVPAIADALGYSFGPGKDLKAQILDYLRGKELLLILDNFEHLLGGVELLVEILQQTSEVKLLVTSRERLRLQEEWIFELHGLSYPQADDETPAAESAQRLEEYGAAQLFLHHAGKLQPAFSPSPDERIAIARICRLVEGVPLGLELAAVWVRLLTCQEIVQELESSLDFLVASTGDVAPRHRSLRAVFEHSWTLLAPQEQAAFPRLTVFRGGFQRRAAEQVAGAPLAVLSGLVDKSLLRVAPAAGGGMSYSIHELLRQFAAARLELSPPEARETRDLHCRYYARFLNQKEADLTGAGQKEALQAIAAQVDNVRAAWRWAVRQEKVEEINLSIEGLYLFYEFQGWTQEGAEALQSAAGALVDRGGQIEGEAALALGRLLSRQGKFVSRLGDYQRATDLLEQGLKTLRQLGARREIATALNFLGYIRYRLGDFGQAQEMYQESLAICKQVGDNWRLAEVFNYLGLIDDTWGKYEDAVDHFQQSIAVCQQSGDRRGLARALNNLSNVLINQGRYGEAKEKLQQTIGIFEELGYWWGAAAGLNNLGNAAKSSGDYVQAKPIFERSLALFRELGFQGGIAACLHNLGSVVYHLGDLKQAEKLCLESLEHCNQIGYLWGIAMSKGELGQVFTAGGEFAKAKQHFLEALRAAAQTQAVPVMLTVFVGMAEMEMKLGQNERALELLAFALAHSATEQIVREKAKHLLGVLKPQFTPDVFEATKKKAETRELEQFVAELSRQAEVPTR